MKTIARLAGVSRMTVSRALRNDPLLSGGTVRKVHEIAGNLGYRPDPRVSELMSHLRRTRCNRINETIAHVRVVDTGDANPGADLSSSRVMNGAARAANQAGYRFERLSWRIDQCDARRMAGILHARGIRGVVIHNQVRGFSLGGICDHLACAVVGIPPLKCCVHRTGPNHHLTIEIAMEKLGQSGYRRVGLFLSATASSHTEHIWHCAFLTHQFEQDMLAPERACVAEHPDANHFRRWFASVRPDAVVTDRQEVLTWLADLGAEVPVKVGFVQLDWSTAIGPCAGVDQRLEEVGAVALDFVHRQLMDNHIGPPDYPLIALTNVVWVDGDSIRPPVEATLSLQPA